MKHIVISKHQTWGLVATWKSPPRMDFVSSRSQEAGSPISTAASRRREYIIPVLTIQSSPQEQQLSTGIQLTIELGGDSITTRVCMVKIEGKATKLVDLQPPKIRVEIWSEGNLISQPFGALYGHEQATGDVQLRMSQKDPQSIDPNTVTLLIPPEIRPGKSASIHLPRCNDRSSAEETGEHPHSHHVLGETHGRTGRSGSQKQ